MLSRHTLTMCWLACKVQYKIELATAEMQDNPSGVSPVAERLRVLRRHQNAWNELQWNTELVVDMPDHPMTWELHSGAHSSELWYRNLAECSSRRVGANRRPT